MHITKRLDDTMGRKPNYNAALIAAMYENNINAADLARVCNTNSSVIRGYLLNGATPRYERAVTIAQTLGKSLSELFDTESIQNHP